jgi:hypothetical protein
MKPVTRQRIGKHVSAATNTHTAMELLSQTVFSIWSVPGSYLEENWGDPVSREEACSNTSTVALRVVGGDEKGTECLGV